MVFGDVGLEDYCQEAVESSIGDQPLLSDSDVNDKYFTFWQDDALNLLVQYVESGVEYPIAHTNVCSEMNLTVEQGEELQALYDELG
jgi:hypothetical protein